MENFSGTCFLETTSQRMPAINRDIHNLPGPVLKLLARRVGDLLVGAAQLVRVDLIAAGLLLRGVEACSVSIQLSVIRWGLERTLVKVVLLLVGTAGTTAGAGALLVVLVLATELGSETGEFVHDVQV